MAAPPAGAESTAGIELVVTDLDGTLWDGDERIHDTTRAALRELIRRGMPVLVATGRRLGSARRRLSADQLHLPIVALDGAVGRDGERRFAHRVFDDDELRLLLAAFAERDLRPVLYVDDADAEVVVPPQATTSARHLEILDGAARRMPLDEAVARHGVHAVGLYGVTGPRAAALAELMATVDGRLPSQGGLDPYFGGRSAVVYPPGTSKWEGVLDYCAETGLDPSRVLAIGDGPNDLELLTGARTAVVVADGCEAALALADHVVEPASAGGWATLLEHLEADPNAASAGRV